LIDDQSIVPEEPVEEGMSETDDKSELEEVAAESTDSDGEDKDE